jgi:nickel-dependent lactate racemase
MKKTFQIPYGLKTLPLEIEESLLKAVLVPHAESESSPTLEEQADIVIHAIDHPIGSPRLADLAKGKQRVLIITSDHTRPMPSIITMPILLSIIRNANPCADIRILLATGMHRPTTAEEMAEKFGLEIVQNETLLNHIASKDEDMVYKGILPSGGELWLNNHVDWADLILSEGFIEPHFFAGFSGGRKSILPGIASHKTVLYNHNAGFIDDPHSVQGNLEGNLLHRDMCFAAKAANLSFILNVRLDNEKRIVAAYAGDPSMAHEAGCRECLAKSCVDKVEGDIVVTSNGGYPLDQNIYQAVKGMSTGAACVKSGGVIIMASECQNGHGGDDFFNWFASAKSPAEVAAKIASTPAERTLPDQWEAQILARILKKARCIFVTRPENEALVKSMYMTYAPDLNTALEMAYGWTGPSASVVVIPNGTEIIVR